MYESPITLYQRRIVDGVQLHIENETIKAILACDIKVDKDELLRALSYDRDQYEKGHADGYMVGYESKCNEIVHCKDCKRRYTEICGLYAGRINDKEYYMLRSDDFFCAYGERRCDDA